MQDWISQAVYGGKRRNHWKDWRFVYLPLGNLGIGSYCCSVYVLEPQMENGKKGRPRSKSSVNDDGNRRPVALKMMTSPFNFLSHPINLYLSENRRRSVGVERPMSRFVNYLIKTFVWHPEVIIAMSQSSWPPELKWVPQKMNSYYTDTIVQRVGSELSCESDSVK